MQDFDMIIDEIKNVYKFPELTDSKDKTTKYIKESIVNAIVPFKKTLLDK